jgi:hemin uptake protein HemP
MLRGRIMKIVSGKQPPSRVAGDSSGRTAARQTIDSRDLLTGADCVVIQHGDQRYCLRNTRQGKLLLTK